MVESKQELEERLQFIEVQFERAVDAALNCMTTSEKADAMVGFLSKGRLNDTDKALAMRDKLTWLIYEFNETKKRLINASVVQQRKEQEKRPGL